MRTRGERLGAPASYLVDGSILFGLSALLIWPLFQVTYLDNWGSIDSIFIAHARFLVENWPYPGWQPLWYGGTRFDYIYPPALPYGTALLSQAFAIPVARAYHLYTALFYCLGIAGVYVFVRTVSRSRPMAWLAAAASGLVSPCFLFLHDIYLDAASRHFPPQRLNVLAQWGEGPHMSALAVVPLALAACYWTLRHRSRPGLALASLLCALVVSNNFYGAVALAIFLPILVWSWWLTHRDHRAWLWIAAIAALSYGLTALWLVPSYIKITRANLALVGAGSNPLHLAGAAIIALLFLALSYRLAWGRPERCYPIFVAGAALAFGMIILGDSWLGLKILGSTNRMVPEMDLAFILAALALLHWLWNRAPHWWPGGARASRWAAGALALLALLAASPYVRHAWTLYPVDPDYQQRVEYRLTRWMAENLPDVRSFADGSLRLWYTAWFDLQQLGGGSEQGLLNQAILPAHWEIRTGENGETAVQWMRCFGVDAVVVHDESSEELFHDFHHPRKFAGLLPVLFDEGLGDVIYRVPRRYPGLARVVEKARVEGLRPIEAGWGPADLEAYVEAVEQGPDSPPAFEWHGPNETRIDVDLKPGEMVLVQASYDPAWRAYSRQRPLPIRKDVLGQMLIEAPAERQTIRLVFEVPVENQIGRLLTAISVVTVIGLFWSGRPRSRPAPPGHQIRHPPDGRL